MPISPLKLPVKIRRFLYSDILNQKVKELVKKYDLSQEFAQDIGNFVISFWTSDIPRDPDKLDEWVSQVIQDPEKIVERYERWDKLPDDVRESLMKDIFSIFILPLDEKYDVGIKQMLKEAGYDIKPALNFDEVVIDEMEKDLEYIDDPRLETYIEAYKRVVRSGNTDQDDRKKKLSDIFVEFISRDNVRKVVDISKKYISSGDFSKVKSDFYDAINEKNKEKFLACLLALFASGKVMELFRNDERYIKFWRHHVLEMEGLDSVRMFDENPGRMRQFGKFIRYIMKERFNMQDEEAVMWAVLLSAVAHKHNDREYEKLAVGNVKTSKFEWNL